MKALAAQAPTILAIAGAFLQYKKNMEHSKSEDAVTPEDKEMMRVASGNVDYIGLVTQWDLWSADNALLVEEVPKPQESYSPS